jgi:hypothetical protein
MPSNISEGSKIPNRETCLNHMATGLEIFKKDHRSQIRRHAPTIWSQALKCFKGTKGPNQGDIPHKGNMPHKGNVPYNAGIP